MAASYDAETGKLKLYQEPCVTPTNGGLGMSLLHPADETTSYVETTSNLKPRSNMSPFLMAASTLVDKANRYIQGGHYKEAIEPIELPEQTLTYNGKIDRPNPEEEINNAGPSVPKSGKPSTVVPGFKPKPQTS